MTTRLLWRTTVPAVGLAAAFVVGWRLAPALTVLVVVCAWLPLGLWCLFAPRTPAALPIALALLALIATIRWTLPGRPGDRTLEITWSTLMWYSLVGLLPLLVAIWRPRLLRVRAAARTADRAGSSRRLQTTATLVIAGALVLGCCCGGSDNILFANEVPAPSSFELLPLPAGMQGTVAAGPDGETGCDNAAHSCWINFRVTGRPDESTFDLNTRVRQHLQEAKGWDGQWPCRPVHWFVQQAPADFCINMTDDPASTPDRHPTIDVELIISNLVPPP